MKKYILIFTILLLTGVVWFYIKHPLETRMQINNHVFVVELAITEAEKEKGLGYRDNLAPDHGMLFPYDHAEKYSYWMKGMRFPLDIIWIRDGKIVDITKNVPVATTLVLPVYSPKEPVNQVLELNAGTSDRDGIKVGDAAIILR